MRKFHPTVGLLAAALSGACVDADKTNRILEDTQKEMQAMRVEMQGMREPMDSISTSMGEMTQAVVPVVGETRATLASFNALVQAVPPEKLAELLGTVNGFSTEFARLNETLAGFGTMMTAMSPEKFSQGLETFTALAGDFKKVNETMARMSSYFDALPPEKLATALDGFDAMSRDFQKMNETTARLAAFVEKFDAEKIGKSMDQFSALSTQFGEAVDILKGTNASIQGFTQISTVGFALLFKMFHAVGFVDDAQAETYAENLTDFMTSMVPVADRAKAENVRNIANLRELMKLKPEQKMSFAGIQAQLEDLNKSLASFDEMAKIFKEMRQNGELKQLTDALKAMTGKEPTSMSSRLAALNTQVGKISGNFPLITEVTFILGVLMTCNTIEIHNASIINPMKDKRPLPAMCTDFTYAQRVSRLWQLVNAMNK